MGVWQENTPHCPPHATRRWREGVWQESTPHCPPHTARELEVHYKLNLLSQWKKGSAIHSGDDSGLFTYAFRNM